MTDLRISREARRLTDQEKEQFQEWGYVKNLPVFRFIRTTEASGRFSGDGCVAAARRAHEPRQQLA